jgi:hypothetical protein
MNPDDTESAEIPRLALTPVPGPTFVDKDGHSWPQRSKTPRPAVVTDSETVADRLGGQAANKSRNLALLPKVGLLIEAVHDLVTPETS